MNDNPENVNFLNKINIFIVLLSCCIVSAITQTSLTTALPAVMHNLQINANTGQWLTSIYTLAMGIMIPVTPFLIKYFSTKKLFFITIIVFAIGLFLAAIATNFQILLVGRVLQAFSSGIFLSLTQVIILQIFPAEKVGTYMGIYGFAIGGVPVFAPTLAGVIVDNFGWQTIFIGSAVLVSLIFFYAIFTFKNVSENEQASLDLWSVLLSTIGFGGILLGLGNIGKLDFLSYEVCLPIVVGLCSLLLFVHRQLTIKEPLLNLIPFKNKNFVISVLSSMILYAVMMAGSIMIPLYLQSLRGDSATVAGLVTLPGSIVLMVVSPVSGKIYDKFGIKFLLVLGSILLFISCIGLTTLTGATSVIYISIIYGVRMFAIGLIMMPLVTWGIANLDNQLTTHASAILTSLRTISGAVGSAVFVAIMTSVGHGRMSIHGMNISFFGLAMVALALIVLAAISFFSKKKMINFKI